MKTYLAKTPKIIRKLFSNYTWSVSTNNKELYLTFDDGPTPEITSWVLSELNKYNAKATFFCVGDNIVKYPDLFKDIIQQEHKVANHTFNHLNGWKSDNKYYFINIEQAEEIIKNQGGRQSGSKLFRPPYGKIRSSQEKVLRQKGYNIIMWDVLSGDFDQNLSKDNCLKNVINSAQKGSIIVFHDSIKSFKNLEYVLPKVLKYFIKKGYVFKAL